MKILFDHQIFCLQQYGGISRYFHELANHIAGSPKQEASIFAPVYINEYLSTFSVVSPRGIKIQELFGFGRVGAWGIDITLARTMLKPQGDVDIFHEIYYSGIDSCPRSAKRMVTVFDMTHEKFSGTQPGRDKTRQAKAGGSRAMYF